MRSLPKRLVVGWVTTGLIVCGARPGLGQNNPHVVMPPQQAAGFIPGAGKMLQSQAGAKPPQQGTLQAQGFIPGAGKMLQSQAGAKPPQQGTFQAQGHIPGAGKMLQFQAGAKPGPQPWHAQHHGWYFPQAYYPPVNYYPIPADPVGTVPTTTYYPPADPPEASNPVPTADIRLVNPSTNVATLKYRLDDGNVQALPAGSGAAIGQPAVITFDRGGTAGAARYQLTEGVYRFVVRNGAWDLVHQASQAAETPLDDSANPVPGY